jgi:predicted membrane chloride channel (bestrophin family)
MKARWVKKGVKVGVTGVVAVAVFGFVVMSLWNWLAPAVFGLRSITFWQALGILILSKILFGGFRGRAGYGGHWRRRMKDRWQQMTPEEREQFRQGMFSRRGGSDAATEGSPDPRDA